MTDRVLWSFDRQESVDEWKTVDDVVMGGRSASRLEWIPLERSAGAPADGAIRFTGEVSLENNGGFCSARMVEEARGLPSLRALEVTARGDGQRYKWTLRTEGTPPNSSWRLPVETVPDEWKTYELELGDFELWQKGTLLNAEARPNLDDVTSFGVLISDEQEGPFRLDLAEVRAAAA